LTTAIACTFPFTHTHNYETYTLSLHDALPIYISAHQSCEPPFKTGFGCGNFLRRRRRIQLFQVLRTLSRGVRYCSLSSLLFTSRSEEHTSELQSLAYLVCRLLLEKKKIVLEGC